MREIEVEKRKRINVALWAYAYEIMDDPLVPDERYDRVSREINPAVLTGHAVLDAFFREEFSPDTGMWIHAHPEWRGFRRIYERLTSKRGHDIHQGGKANGKSALPGPFDTHFETMCWLHLLGFAVVPGYYRGTAYRFDGGNLLLHAMANTDPFDWPSSSAMEHVSCLGGPKPAAQS